jgi:L-lactate dehydrogenase
VGLLTIVEAILRDQHSVLTVSSGSIEPMASDGISPSLPAIVGRRGMEGVLALPLSVRS